MFILRFQVRFQPNQFYAPKVSMVADDLIVLDSKFIPVTNDKGQFTGFL